MQPLDRTFFKSLKMNYNRAADSWMTTNPGKRITFFEMSGLFQVAYNRAATIEKAVNEFRVSGIWPYDAEIFTDEDFSAAEVTEEPEPAGVTSSGLLAPPAVVSSIDLGLPVQAGAGVISINLDQPGQAGVNDSSIDLGQPEQMGINVSSIDLGQLVQAGADVSSIDLGQPVQTEAAVSSIDLGQPVQGVFCQAFTHPGLVDALKIINDLSPRPKISSVRPRKRKAQSAAVITLSPYKQKLEAIEEAKKNKKVKAVNKPLQDKDKSMSTA